MSYGYGDHRTQPGGYSTGGGYGGGGYAAPPAGGYGGVYGPPGGAPPGGGPGYTSHGGGFAAPVHHGAPPGADPQLWGWFAAVDTDRSGAITAAELQKALVNGDWTPFDIDTVKLLIGIFDVDRSGTIGFKEFAGIWQYIQEWQNVFRHFDRDRSGTIEKDELQRALAQFGYHLSPYVVGEIQKKYGSIPVTGPSGRPIRGHGDGISFDRFVRACVTVKQLTETFERLSGGNRHADVRMNYEQFMSTVLSLP